MNAVVQRSFVDQAIDFLHRASLKQALSVYREIVHDPQVTDAHIAEIGRRDRFFLLTHILHRPDAIHPWLYERCRQVEADTDGHLDLWARDHYKSTIITFAGTIQEILNNPEITIGIFSHSKGIARKFLKQIKRELESNTYLKNLYSDVLYENPEAQAKQWSDSEGIIVRRKNNPAEATVEAWGLVDGQPIGKHFMLMIYDDVVTRESVTTPDQIFKTTDSWELSLSLADSRIDRQWYIGTRYNDADTYRVILARNIVKPRVFPATDNGQIDGRPVFLSPHTWAKKLKENSLYNLCCQYLQNPQAGSNNEFTEAMWREYEVRPRTLNVYIMVDYAGSRKTGSSNTAIAVVGLDAAMNKYLLDGACHKMTLSERWKLMKHYRKKWLGQIGVQIVSVGYERYGAQNDIEHFEEMMQIEGEAFEILELNTPREGELSKDERIRRLEPDHRNSRWFYPRQRKNDTDITKRQLQAIERGEIDLVAKEIKHVNEQGRVYNLLAWFKANEYPFFPNTKQKDFFDAMSRIYDMEIAPPVIYNESDVYPMVPED